MLAPVAPDLLVLADASTWSTSSSSAPHPLVGTVLALIGLVGFLLLDGGDL